MHGNLSALFRHLKILGMRIVKEHHCPVLQIGKDSWELQKAPSFQQTTEISRKFCHLFLMKRFFELLCQLNTGGAVTFKQVLQRSWCYCQANKSSDFNRIMPKASCWDWRRDVLASKCLLGENWHCQVAAGGAQWTSRHWRYCEGGCLDLPYNTELQ